jgi:hypothetical protein
MQNKARISTGARPLLRSRAWKCAFWIVAARRMSPPKPVVARCCKNPASTRGAALPPPDGDILRSRCSGAGR